MMYATYDPTLQATLLSLAILSAAAPTAPQEPEAMANETDRPRIRPQHANVLRLPCGRYARVTGGMKTEWDRCAA